MSDILRNKFCVIGASQSGKTTFVIEKLMPKIAYDRIVLCGADHNINVYTTASHVLDQRLKRRRQVFYFGYESTSVLQRLASLNTALRASPKKKASETLVIFDDFVNPKAISSTAFLDFIATCRHSRITVIFICHSVDIVVTSFMKSNMTHFIICQYAPSRNFSEFMHTFLDPIICDRYIQKNGRTPSEKELRNAREIIIQAAFTGRFGKIVISVIDRTFQVVKPIPIASEAKATITF
jgi:hypothetical protein